MFDQVRTPAGHGTKAVVVIVITFSHRLIAVLKAVLWTHPGHSRCPRRRLVQAIRHVIEVRVEQPGVHVERHRRRSVAKHLLHNLGVRARLHSQARRRVPQIVNPETVRPRASTASSQIRYDSEMKTLLPVLMASISVVAALSERAYLAFDPLVSQGLELDAQIGKAASSIHDGPDRTREEVGELKDPAFSLFRQFRNTLATEMGRHGTDVDDETASWRDREVSVEHTHQ